MNVVAMLTFRVKWLSALDYKKLGLVADYIGYDKDAGLNVYRLNPAKAASIGLDRTIEILGKLGVYLPENVKEKIGELEGENVDTLLVSEGSDLVVYSANRRLRRVLEERGIAVWDSRSGTLRAKPMMLHEIIGCAGKAGSRIKLEFTVNYALTYNPILKLELRKYQREAFEKWVEAGFRGIIVLPTGAGKTLVGLKCIEYLKVKTLILVPTIELLNQWRDKIVSTLNPPPNTIGVYGGGRREIREITIMTYDSASINLWKYSTYFGLIIADECHHAVSPSYMRALEESTAPYRLGLTATPFRSDGLHKNYEKIIGGIVYTLSHVELQEEGYLAKHVEKKIYVELSREEYEEYRRLIEKYLEYCNRKLRGVKDPRERFRRVLAMASRDPEAREALRAKNSARKIALSADKKIMIVEELLEKHPGEKVIVFSRYTDIVREISRKLLVPMILHDTPRDERKKYLELFRKGDVRIIATAMVLDEGVDVPDASMAIVVSGTGSYREYVQRLGRILRPKEKKALLYEIITKRTIEPSLAKRRRKPELFEED